MLGVSERSIRIRTVGNRNVRGLDGAKDLALQECRQKDIGYCRKCPEAGTIHAQRTSILKSRLQRQQIQKDVIIFQRFVMQVIGADAEIKWATEIGGQAEFLTQLPGIVLGKILSADEAGQRTAELRIAEITRQAVTGIIAR